MSHEFKIFKRLPKISFEKCFNECSKQLLGGAATVSGEGSTEFDKLLTLRDAMDKNLQYSDSFGFASVENNTVRYIVIGKVETWKNKDDMFHCEFIVLGNDSNNSRSYIYDIKTEYKLLGDFLKQQGFKWHRSTPIVDSTIDHLMMSDLYRNNIGPYMQRENISDKEYLHLL